EENRKSVMIILGLSCEIDSKENYGFLLYHKNRLIKPYLKIGCQKQANEKGVGIIGVAELDFLIPTHNKQDFVRDEHYNTVLNTLSFRLNTYLSDQNQAGDVADVPLPDWTWAQCETCLKWRRLPKDIDPASLPKLWYCHMNQDVYYNRCFTEQEPEEETLRKSKRKKGSSQCGDKENGMSSKKLFSSQPETFQENSETTVGGGNTRSKRKIAMPLEPPKRNHDDDDAGDDFANGQESSTVKIPNRKAAKRKLRISATESITKMSNIQKELSSSKGSSSNLCSSSKGKSPKRKIISSDTNSEQPQSSKNICVNGDDLQATGIIKKSTQRNIKSLQKSRNIETQSLNASQTVNTRSYVAKHCTNDTGFSDTDSNTLDNSPLEGMTQNTGDDTGTETQEPEVHDVVVVDDDDDFDLNNLPLKCRPIIKSEPVTSEESNPNQLAETEEMERVAGSFKDREEESEDLAEVSRDSPHGEIKLTPFHYKVYRLLKYLAPSTDFGDTSEVEDIVNKLLENFENSEIMN
ncbi:MORC family CW-type zinc finger protein 3-like isoform X1, partial [Biomphalaria pfeifferi]